MTIESEVSVDDKNRFLVELITQCTRVAAKVRPGSTRSRFIRPAWWRSECNALNERQMELFGFLGDMERLTILMPTVDVFLANQNSNRLGC
jgi:hypothetical protein